MWPRVLSAIALCPVLINGFTALQNPSSSSPPPFASHALAAQSLTNSDCNSSDNKVVENSRRALLVASAAAAVAVGARAGPSGLSSWYSEASMITPSSSSSNIQLVPSVSEAIQLIDASCDRSFLHAVVASDYRFLYRGIDESVGTPTVRTEAHDLLDFQTYQSQDALRFFTKLETDVLQDDLVKPSNGHLGITSAAIAATWGTTAASIWPLAGESVHFAWFEEGGQFWPRSIDIADRKQMIIDGRDCGKESLEDALRGENWEVLFSGQSFLAVPVQFEKELREGLKNSFIM